MGYFGATRWVDDNLDQIRGSQYRASDAEY